MAKTDGDALFLARDETLSPGDLNMVGSTMQETQVQPLGREDSPEKEMAAHSNILARGIPMDRGVWWARILEWVAIPSSRGSS